MDVCVKCEFCGYMLPYKSDLQRRIAENDTSGYCECQRVGCQQVFMSACNLRQHQQLFSHLETGACR